MSTAQTGRTHDLHPTASKKPKKSLDPWAPSTHDLKATLGLLSVQSHREPLNCSMKSKLAIEFNGLDVERPCGDLELRNTLLPGPCLRRFQQRPSHTGTACA